LLEQLSTKIDISVLIISSFAGRYVLVELGKAPDSYIVPTFNDKLSASVLVKDAAALEDYLKQKLMRSSKQITC